MRACEDVSQDVVLPVLVKGEQIERKDKKSGNSCHTTSTECYQKTREQELRIASLTEKLLDSSSKETVEASSNIKEAKIERYSAFPSPPPSSSSSSLPSSSENKNLLTTAKESGKESVNYFFVKNPSVTSCISISTPSLTMTMTTTTAAAATTSSLSSSSPKKKTPLNTDFETEDYSSKNSNLPLISKSDQMYPIMPCRSNILNTDSEIEHESNIKEDTKMLDSMENNEPGIKGIADNEQESISKVDNVSPDVQRSSESCSYQMKRGQKRKRGLSEDDESGGEDGKENDYDD